MNVPVVEHNLEMIPNRQVVPILHVTQYDVGRTFTMHLTMNCETWTPGTGAVGNILVKRPDGVRFKVDATVSGSDLSFDLPKKMATVNGMERCTFQVTDGATVIGVPVDVLVTDAVDLADSTKTIEFDGTVEDYETQRNQWFKDRGAEDSTPEELTELCNRWYELTRPDWDGGVAFSQPNVSTISTGIRFGDNAGMSCSPSTDTVAGTDDYAGHPLFAVTTVNWTLDDNGEVLITAIKGVSGDFEQNNPEKFVGVMQMSASTYQAEKALTYERGYTANLGKGTPLPEAIKLDGTVRQFVCHSKYMAGTVKGKLTCCSGVIPTDKMSHNAGITAARTVGANYSGGTVVDWSFIYLMTLIKYASMTLDGIINGCFSYNFQYPALVAETGVQRVLVSASYKNNILVGSSVLVGNYAGNKDRGQGAMRSIAIATVAAVETITVNETQYAAVYLNCPSFDTAANGADTDGTTYISSWHWMSGTNDDVLGNDGCHGSCTDAKHPAMIQGIEFAVGAYEVFTDVILNIADGVYTPYIARQATHQATSVTANMVASELTSAQPDANAWCYIRKMSYDGELFFGTDEDGGSSSTYTKDAFYKNDTATTTGTLEWLAFGALNSGVGNGGPACLFGDGSLGVAGWYCALRLSCNGNRGELAA